MLSVAFVLAEAQWTRSLPCSKTFISGRNMQKRSMHVLLILKKHMIAFLETSFGQCCYSIDGQLLTAIKSLYMHSEVCVRVNSATTKNFRVSAGLWQGCSLSPISFCIYMDRIVKNSESGGEVKIGDCTVQRLLFADDLVLLDST